MKHESNDIERKLIDDGLKNNPELLDKYADLYDDFHVKACYYMGGQIVKYLVVVAFITLFVNLFDGMESMRTAMGFLYGSFITYVLLLYLSRIDHEKKYKERIERLKGTQEDEIQ